MDLDEEETRVKSLIEEEEILSSRLFSELSDKNIKLIILNSQLAAEKGRTNYIWNLLSIKDAYPYQFDEDHLKIIQFGFKFEEFDTRVSTFEFSKKNSDASLYDSDEQFDSIDNYYNEKSLSCYKSYSMFSQYDEKHQSLSIPSDYKELQSSLELSKKKNLKLKQSLDYNLKTIENLEESNEKYKEITLNFDQQMLVKDSEIQRLKNQLSLKEKQIKDIRHKRDVSHEEAMTEKTTEINKLKVTIRTMTEKFGRLEEDSRKIQEGYENLTSKRNLEIKRLRIESEGLNAKINALNEEVDDLRRELCLKNQELRKSQEMFEQEREEIIYKYKNQIDELKIQIKLGDYRADAMISPENSDEFSGENDVCRRVNTEPNVNSLDFELRQQDFDITGNDFYCITEFDSEPDYYSQTVTLGISEINKLRIENSGLTKENSELIEKINTLENKCSCFEKKLNMINLDYQETLKNHRMSVAFTADLEHSIKELRNNYSRINEENVIFKKTLEDFKENSNRIEHENKILSLESQHLSDDNKKLKIYVQNLQRSSELLFNENLQKAAEIDLLNSRLKISQENSNKLSIDHLFIISNYNALKSTLYANQEIILDISAKVTAGHAKSKKLADRLNLLFSENAILKAERLKFKQKFEMMQNLVRTITDINFKLERQVDFMLKNFSNDFQSEVASIKSRLVPNQRCLAPKNLHVCYVGSMSAGLTKAQVFLQKIKETSAKASLFFWNRKNPVVSRLFSKPKIPN